MDIRKYDKQRDESRLMALIENEGEEWAEETTPAYREALLQSLTYVAYEGDKLCGFSRSLDDCGMYIYICDLLVHPEHRRKGIGKALLDCLYHDFPDRVVYVMSDNDGYYERIGYHKRGTVFEAARPDQGRK